MAQIQVKDKVDSQNDQFNVENKEERISVIDYKMVTFSLAGKDYAINIMQVKEIAKAGRFTYVPNTSPFVLGVYNLRGDIIPIIDLRIFFNIPVKVRENDALENMIIIHVDEQTFGIVVDAIDKVVGISQSTIQPPHPIFGDINIKYIQGVVENQGRLYILLEVTRIFGTKARLVESEKIQQAEETLISAPPPAEKKQTKAELDVSFIGDSLSALVKFYVSHINDAWVKERYIQWRDLKDSSDVQLQSEESAREYLASFYSPFTGKFWDSSYAKDFLGILPENQAKQINVWNIGCSKGYESYSIALLLKERYPSAKIKVYANDSDLLAISNAPMLSMNEQDLSPRYKNNMVQGVNGNWTFSQTVKDSVLFEYHDCTNQNAVPNMDIIVVRDVLSFMNLKQQATMLAEIHDKLKDNGFVILGKNEAMPQHSGWLRIVQGEIVAFSKE